MKLTDLLITLFILESFQTTVSVKNHGDRCSDTSSCEVNTSCVMSVDNTTRCLCSDDEYRSDRNQCVNTNTLLVEDVRTVKVTSNSVKLNWTSQNINYKEAKYNVSYEDTYTLGDEDGVTIYNLKPDTNYNFTIQVILFKNQVYKARYGLPRTHFARTLVKQDSKKSHGELCTKGVDSCQTEFLCVQNKNQEDRCLCDHNHYWNDLNECISTLALTIKNFTAVNIYSTSVELSWSIDPLNKTSAQFKLSYGSKNIKLFHSDVMAATIDKLKPETLYTFTMKVQIPADKKYNLTEGPPSIIFIPTSISHGDLCNFTNSPCEPGTSCFESPTKQYRCLCNSSQYWSKNRTCVPLKRLTVTEVQVKRVTSTSVQLSWSNRTIEKLSAAYNVTFTNKSLAARPEGINITNLQPNRNYSFEIFVIIPNELNYKEKRGPGVSIIAQTITEGQTQASVFEKTTPTHQTTILPTDTHGFSRQVTTSTTTESAPSSSGQVLTHTSSTTTASGQSSTNIVIVVIVVLLVVAVLFIVIVVLVLRRKNSERKSLTQFLLDKYDKLRNAPQPEHTYTELEPKTYSTSQDIATNTMNATNHNLPSPSNGASSPSAYYNCKAQEEVKVETIYSHLSHFKGQERENTENVYDG